MATQPAAVAARTRAALTGAIVVAAGLWGAAVGLLIYRLFASPLAAMGCAALAIVAVLWRGRYAGSMQRVALWVEEQAPALQYALVTAVDPQYSGTNDGARTAAVAAVNVGTMVGRAVIRTAGVPLLALAAATLVPAASYRRLTATVGDASNRLTPLTARITPPTYARLPAHELSDPSTIPALVGSAIALEGRRGWRKDLTMPASPAAVRLVDRQFERLIVLDPIVDAPPTVVLTAPARDATIREPATGTLTLVAEGADDIGLHEGYFEYLITSGEEDVGGVHAREAHTGRVAFADTKTGTLRAILRLDTLGLKGGDLLSVRAVVRDGNTLSGPSVGTSETRTIRVATQQEYDSLALDAQPPQDVDTVDKVETGNRLYLRGPPPGIVVDVDRVRMKGTSKPEAGPRTPVPASDTLRAQVAARFAAAVERLSMDSLTVLRVDALRQGNAPLAAALNDAVDALQAGTDARPALARARRAIMGTPVASGTLSAWGGP